MPEDGIAAWEPEFGEDPRFWELRYLCRFDEAIPGKGSIDTSFTAEQLNLWLTALEPLQEARRRGVADANTLLVLYIDLAQIDRYRAQAVEDAGDGTAPLPAAEDLAAELALLDEAISLEPKQAWPYYLRAVHWFEQQEWELGLSDLEAGNRAPRNEFPYPYPLAEIEQGMLENQPRGSAAVAGALIAAVHNRLELDFRRIKSVLDKVLDNGYTDGRMLEAWHQFACRFSQTAPRFFIWQSYPYILLAKVRDYALENTDLDPDQRLTLELTFGAIGEIKDSYVRGEYLAPALILLLVGGVRGLSLVYYLNEQRDVTIYQPYVETTVPARAEIHYPELETPPGLLRLEQLAQREMAAREEGRKRHEAWEREQAEADESP